MNNKYVIVGAVVLVGGLLFWVYGAKAERFCAPGTADYAQCRINGDGGAATPKSPAGDDGDGGPATGSSNGDVGGSQK